MIIRRTDLLNKIINSIICGELVSVDDAHEARKDLVIIEKRLFNENSKIINKEYYKDNKHRILNYNKKWNIKNKDKRRKYIRNYKRKYCIRIKGILYSTRTCEEKVKPILEAMIAIREKKMIMGRRHNSSSRNASNIKNKD